MSIWDYLPGSPALYNYAAARDDFSGSPNPFSSPEFGSLITKDPNLAATHLAANGIAPPTSGQSLFDLFSSPGDHPFSGRGAAWLSSPMMQNAPTPPPGSQTTIRDLIPAWSPGSTQQWQGRGSEYLPPPPPVAEEAPASVNTAVPDILAPVAPGQPPLATPGTQPVPLPQPKPGMTAGASPLSDPASGAGKTMSQKLAESMKTLSGVKAPTPPAAQKISSPHVPSTQMNTPGAGALAALLTQATQGQQNTTSPVLRLAQALSGR